MKYTVGVLVLLALATWFHTLESRPKPERSVPTKVSGPKLFARHTILKRTPDGYEYIPRGSQVERLTDTTVRYLGVVFEITHNDVFTEHERQSLERSQSEEYRRRAHICEQIDELDRCINQIGNELMGQSVARWYGERQGKITARGPTIQRLRSQLIGLQVARSELQKELSGG